MAEAYAENRNLSVENDFGANTEISYPIWTSWSGGDYDVVKMIAELKQLSVTAEGVIEDDLWLDPIHSGEEVVDVVSVAVVVVDEKGSYRRSWEKSSLQLEKELAHQPKPPRHVASHLAR